MAENSAPAGGQMSQADIQAAEELSQAYQTIRKEMAKAIVGQEQVLEELLMCIFARGHAILEGVPGLAKTLMVSSLSQCLDLDFARIQFTNLILADEINRTPPKTQAALLEAMQERQVSVGGRRMPMAEPFFVLATQNPIEQEGTYPLPEAQQDRFMFKIFVDYPTWEEEFDVIRLTTAVQNVEIQHMLTGEKIVQLQGIIRRVPVADHVIEYAMKLVRATRVLTGQVPEFIRDYISWGAGPRACQYLILGGKVRAVLHGRFHVSTEDIQAVAKPVLRHRIVTNFNADAEGMTPDAIIERLVQVVPAQQSSIAADRATGKAVQQ